MRYFNPIQRNNSLPASLDSIATTFRDLEQGHQKAVEFTSELETAMANLDLNEAEDEWRQQKIAQIRNTLNENTQYGNATGAIDDLVRARGEISADPGMIGRIRAQKDYKTYMNNLDNNKNISEDIKNYYREKTKYHYEDILDNNGKVVGGTKWEPEERPVDQVDMNDVFTKALTYMSPDSGGGNSITFLDPSTGRTSSKYTPGSQWVTFSNITGKFEKLPPEKIQAAVEAVINGNPAIKASLEQDFKIDKWKYDKNPEIFTDAYDNKGYLKTFDRYVQDKIDPFIVAKQYNNRFTSVSYNDSMLNTLAAQAMTADSSNRSRNSRGGGSGRRLLEEGTPNIPGAKSVRMEQNSMPTVEVLGNIRSVAAQLSKSLNSQYPDLHIPDFTSYTTDSDIENIIKNLTPQQQESVRNHWNAFKQATAASRYTTDVILTSAEDIESADAYNMIQQLNSGHIDPISDKDGEALRQYKERNAQIRNDYFDDSPAIGIKLHGDRAYQNFITQIGNDKIAEYGIKTYKQSDGSIMVSLSAENSDGLEMFANAANFAVKERGIANTFNKFYGIGAGQIFKLDENGNSTEKSGKLDTYKTARSFVLSYITPYGVGGIGNNNFASHVSDLVERYDSFRRDLDSKQASLVKQSAIIDGDLLPFASPYGIDQYSVFQSSDNAQESELARKRMDENTDTYKNMYIGNPAAIYTQNIKIVDSETGEVKIMDSDDKDNFVKTISKAKSSDRDVLVPTTIRMPMIGYMPSFTMVGDENKTYVIMDGIYDPSFEDANNSIANKSLCMTEKLLNCNQAFQFNEGGKTYVVGKSKLKEGAVDFVDENFNILAHDVSRDFIDATSTLSVVLDKYRSGELDMNSQDDRLTLASAYNNYLIQLGYRDEEQRNKVLNDMLSNL